MSSPLPARVALSCLLRTAAVNAAMTARGMQQIGVAYVLAPGLRQLHGGDQEALRRAFARYAAHSNTHAFMLPAYAGILLSLEARIAAGELPESSIKGLRGALATTLSALGDGFFGGALRTTWALCAVCLALRGLPGAAALITAQLVLLLAAFRTLCFFLCLGRGIAALQWLRKVSLASWTERIKVLNAFLIGLVMWLLMAQNMGEWPWLAKVGVFAFVPASAVAVGRLHLPRELLWLLALGAVARHATGYIRF